MSDFQRPISFRSASRASGLFVNSKLGTRRGAGVADQARLEIVRSEMQVRARCAEGRRSGAQTQPDILTYHSMSDRKIMDND